MILTLRMHDDAAIETHAVFPVTSRQTSNRAGMSALNEKKKVENHTGA